MVIDSNSRTEYTANGSTPSFVVPYAFYHQTHLEVYQNGILKTLGTHYTVLPIQSNPGLTVGGVVTFIVTPLNLDVILILRKVPATQLVDLLDLSTFPADQVEKGLDLGVMRIQQQEETALKALRIPFTNISTSTLLADPALTSSWNKAIVVSGDGTGFNLLAISTTDFAQPLTTKGDLVTHNGTTHVRLPLGIDPESVLSVANPPGTTGLAYRLLNTFTLFQDLDNAVKDLDKTIVNPVQNGQFDIWQRGTTFAGVTNAQYTADRWAWTQAGTGVITINRSTNVPTTPSQSPLLFNFSLEIDVTTADAALAVGDTYVLIHKIEGFNWRHFAQRPMVLKFFVRATKTGLHAVSLRNSAADRSFVAEYTINAADTWEEKQVLILASPSLGTWDTQNGIGLQIGFTLAAGATFHATAGAWQTGNFLATSATVNDMDNVANFVRITGAQLYLSNAGVDHPLKYRAYNEELNLCKRYYQKSFEIGTTPVSNAGANTGETFYAQSGGASSVVRGPVIPFRPSLRAVPAIVIFNPEAAGNETRNVTLGANDTATTIIRSSTEAFTINSTSSASAATNHAHVFHWTADAEL